MGLTLFYADLDHSIPGGYRLEPQPINGSHYYKQILSNPDMNLTFQGNFNVNPDELLVCFYQNTFVGGILLHNQPHRHTALHLCLDRVNYKDTIPVFSELAALYALATLRMPMTLVPSNLRAMKLWMTHTMGIPSAAKSVSTIFAGGVETPVNIYLLPDGWTPRHVNNVVFNWRT